MKDPIDIAFLRSWIGKQERGSDTITPQLIKRFKATLCDYTHLGGELESPLPAGIHWCLALPAVARAGLGKDGHPTKGGFLPPVPLARRMWASSHVHFHNQPAMGIPIQKTSTIADVVLKQSTASGPLVFVQVEHAYTQGNRALIAERQNIVYRQPSPLEHSGSKGSNLQPQGTGLSLNVMPDSTLLFRYSALTFNGHRIHYDHQYATGEEDYPGLVVHGPLTATLLMGLAQATRANSPLREFEFRAVAPAFVNQSLHLSLRGDSGAEADRRTLDQDVQLEARNQRNALIMTATARFSDGIPAKE